LDPHSESVPSNLLIQVPGTPLHGLPEFKPLKMVRTIAAARIVMPESTIGLSSGRSSMSMETHALCLHGGASSIFLGDRLLTADNNGDDADAVILDQLDISVRPPNQRVSIEP
jgi:biotin synthase